MDSLLKYVLYETALTLLSIELILMVFCVVVIVITKCLTRRTIRIRTHRQEQISNIIEAVIFKKNNLEQLKIPHNLCRYRDLVEVLEKFDQRFNDPLWKATKEKIVSTYLLPHAARYAASYSWFKRQLAARSYLLCPERAEKSVLTKLLNDSRYLVRVATAVCITQTSHQDLFYSVIRKMSRETILSQFPYRDALLQVNQEKYTWIEALLATESDNAVIAICLDILSTRYSHNLFSIVRPFVTSSNHECRILAIKALGNIPSGEAVEVLIRHLEDSDWEIRADAIISLQKLYAVQSIPKLNLLLNDPIWWVRLQAALTLKIFGKKGAEALNAQDQSDKPKAYEIAQYVMALP